MPLRRLLVLPVLALTVSAVAALAPGPTATPATASTATEDSAPVAGSSPPQRLVWAGCGPDTPASLECATLKVPLDYRRPGGRKIDIAVSRVRTSVPEKRRGVLLFNPGGPGGPGLTYPLMMQPTLPKAVQDRYDLVGFDPRGVGRSTPVACGLTQDEAWRQNHPYRPEQFDEVVAWARKVAEKCRASSSADRIPYITTRNTARDMDAIRAALGERKISYMGLSYGTYLGAVYTQLFPHRADRFVLDSPVGPGLVWRDMFREQVRAAEHAFTAWTEWTAARSATYHLGSTPDEVRETFWGLVARAGREPVELDGVRYGSDELRSGTASWIHLPREAAEFVAGIRRAAEGHSGPSVPPPPTMPDVPLDEYGSAVWSLFCGDVTTGWPRDPERYRHDAIRERARNPLMGDYAANIKPCAFWDRGLEPATVVDNRVGALILQHEWDIATPPASGRSLSRAMKGSRLVFVEGGRGHGVYAGDPDPCAIAVADAYLTTGKLPSRDITCHAPDRQSPRVSGRSAPTAWLRTALSAAAVHHW
ncbi:alpha/beta hydrolase [Streptomyces sp. NPDC004838]